VPKHFRKHGLGLIQHGIVPETQYAKSAFRQHSTSVFVVSQALCVLPSVKFDNQRSFDADEIDNVSGNRKLTPELETAQAPSTQMRPQEAFDVR
jgi:hypothetical protein